jgi:signal transduction histidine kinase
MHSHCQAPFAKVRGDVVHLQQVVLNLIINGIEAMKGNHASDRRLYVSTSSHDESVEVAVRDIGQGIPPEDLQRIFDSFFTTKPDGMGIGLSMSRSIVQWHSGRIWAENNKDGKGTTFRFSLPVAVTAAPHTTTAEKEGECLISGS